jgi:hypothetical protein
MELAYAFLGGRMIRRVLVGALALVACTAAPKPEEVTLTDNRTPIRRIADSTSVLVHVGVDQTDSASLRAQLAASERSPDRVLGFVKDARRSAATAGESFAQAMEKGDRLHQLVMSVGSGDDRPSRFARYWTSSRSMLESARSRSDLAKQAADSALGCAAIPCSAAMANVLKNHMLAAAGAAHEAQSLVRIAMTYVP